MRGRLCAVRALCGAILVLSGVLLIFLCLPARVILIALGAALAAVGLILLR